MTPALVSFAGEEKIHLRHHMLHHGGDDTDPAHCRPMAIPTAMEMPPSATSAR